MKQIHTDVVIIGSGLVGLVAAHGLASLGFEVVVVDKKNFNNSKSRFGSHHISACIIFTNSYFTLSTQKFIPPPIPFGLSLWSI